MKFTAKYETLQKLAAGPVETFLARERATDQKVVVHTFVCRHSAGESFSMRGILADFSAVAPPSLATVIDAGMFDGTSFAYIVTKWTGDAAVGEWVGAYTDKLRVQQQDAGPNDATTIFVAPQGSPREVSTADAAERGFSAPGSRQSVDPAKTPSSAGREPDAPAAGETMGEPAAKSSGVTDLFRWRANAPGQTPADPLPKAPGGFTQQFFAASDGDAAIANDAFVGQANAPSGSQQNISNPTEPLFQGEAGRRDAVSASPAPSSEVPGTNTPKVSAPLMEAVEAGQFTNLFFKSIEPQPRDSPREVAVSGKEETEEKGEFTSFFQGPFSGEQPAAVPKIPADFAPREQTPGDFTQVFGAANRHSPANAQVSQPAQASAATAAPPGSSTGIFAPQNPAIAKGPTAFDWQPSEPVDSAGREFTAEPVVPVERTAVSARPLHEPFGEPRPIGGTGQSVIPSPSEPANATRVFSPQEAARQVAQPAVPDGPSQWTIFQRSEKAASVAPEESVAPPDSKQHGFANVGAGIAGQMVPAVPAWQAPAVPPVTPPQIPYAMPQPVVPSQPLVPTPPAVPVAPPQGTPAPKSAVSYWPLIIVLNVLFILAVLLILYFALKH